MSKASTISSQTQKAIEALTLFNEKTDKLVSSGFLRYLSENGLKVTFRLVGEGESVESTLPDQESVEAFVLNIRFLIQDNEICSIRNLAELYRTLPLPVELRKEFDSTRNELQKYFASTGSLHISGEDLTYGNVFDTFIYGYLVHTNPPKREIYDRWMKREPIAAHLKLEFYSCLVNFLNCILRMRKINIEAITALGGHRT